MSSYPVCLNIEGKECIVVGGGSVAERKVMTLIESGAEVTVISPYLTSKLQELVEEKNIRHISSIYADEFIERPFLIIAATDDQDTNRKVYQYAKTNNILVNVVDDPELCTFLAPAIVRRGDLTISVSTSGKSPLLSRRIKEDIESKYGPEYAELVRLMGEMRSEIIVKYSSSKDRLKAFSKILDSDILDILADGDYDKAKGKAKELANMDADC